VTSLKIWSTRLLLKVHTDIISQEGLTISNSLLAERFWCVKFVEWLAKAKIKLKYLLPGN
jgi:hypothetical protein